MKKILIVSTLFALAAVSAQAQGLINFINGSTTKISTNAVVGGPATGGTAVPTTTLRYRYALYYSTAAATVNGQTAAFDGAASANYAFNDTNWTLVTYGTNFQAGEFISAGPSTSGSGTTVVPGVAGGSTAKFVVIGWSANIGTNIAALQGWFGNPSFNGWIGQSEVSGSITLGTSIGATLFGTSAPEIAGFTLGLVVPSTSVAPVITSQPANATVATGANASFSVGAYGTPSPAYQWMFNSTNVIAGATSGTLTINNVQSTNAGTYSVVITNTAGTTNSFAATLTVTPPSGTGYVNFANYYNISATKIFTNSAVGGAATGLTMAGFGLYNYALYASASATSVNGQTAAILGSASSNYAFNDTNWTLVGYGTNSDRGQFMSVGIYPGAPTPVPGAAPGTTAQFVAIGWSANVGAKNIADVEAWFNGGSPASNGWIGQSAVSGAITLGNGTSIPVPSLFGTNAPALGGFTLGLASPTPSASYTVPYAPPAIMQTSLNGKVIKLSWLTASGSFGVQSAPSPAGPWSDTGWTAASDGTTSSVTNASPGHFYRLVAQ